MARKKVWKAERALEDDSFMVWITREIPLGSVDFLDGSSVVRASIKYPENRQGCLKWLLIAYDPDKMVLGTKTD